MNWQAVDIVGVAACVLALASLLWHCWAWRDSHREKVSAKLRLEAGSTVDLHYSGPKPSTIIAEVVNIGRVPVYLKEVAFERKAKGEPALAFDPVPADGIVRMTLRPRHGQTNPLDVGQGHEFVLPTQGTGFVQRFIDSKRSCFVVWSERRRLCRKKHAVFAPLLERYRDELAPLEEKEQKRLHESTARVDEALRRIGNGKS